MHDAVRAVTEFHHLIGQEVGDVAAPCVTRDSELRARLLDEEVGELRLALEGVSKDGSRLSQRQQVAAVADALADISYVIAGSAVAWGIPLGAVFDEVHRSNMTKTRGDASTGGKAIKGDGYRPPDIERVLGEVVREYRQCWPWPPVFLERHTGEVHERPVGFFETVATVMPVNEEPDRRASKTLRQRSIRHALDTRAIEEVQTNETADARVSIARHRDGSFTVLESESKSYRRDR